PPTVVPNIGWRFIGWDTDPQNKYDQDTTHTAQYEAEGDVIPGGEEKPEGYVTVTFAPGEHGTLEGTTSYHVNPEKQVALTAPTVKANTGYEFASWDAELTGTFTEDTTITATYNEIGDVIPGGEEKPEGYVTVTFAPGEHGTLEGTTSYHVNPEKEVTLIAPTVKANTGWTHTGWDTDLTGKFTEGQVITATYNEVGNVIPGDEDKPAGYVTVTFEAGEHGTLEGTTSYHVNPEKEVTLIAPTVKANTGWTHAGWDTELTGTFAQNTTITATYEENDNEKYEPETEPVVKDKGETPSEDEITGAVTVPNYPEDKEKPKVTIDDPTQIPDGNTPGEYEVDVTVEYPDGSKDKTKVTVTIKDEDQSEKPHIYQPIEGDDKITGTGKPGAKIVVKDEDDNIIGETTVGEDGKWEVKVPEDKPLKKGDKIIAEQTEEGKKPNKAEAIVKGKDTTGGDNNHGGLPFIPGADASEDGNGKDDNHGGLPFIPGADASEDDNGKDDNKPGEKEEDNRTDAEKNPAVAPEKTEVVDTNNLTDKEKAEVAEKVAKANPEASKIIVDEKGNVTLVYPDGSKNYLPASKTVVEKSKGGIKIPARDDKKDYPRRDSKGNKLAGKNVKTGIGSVSGLIGLVGAAAAGLFASKKKEDEDEDK
ncbi:MAG: Rib/alpha-like domain-containing protein, partial [Anaerococcus sp.]|nr:Rib/alpha-like domain-containing protein [Anaerococcus sp.]